MKYKQINFYLTPDTSLGRELLISMVSVCGIDSFQETKSCIEGYCLASNFNYDRLIEVVNDFILSNVKISFKIAQVEDRNWNEEWETNSFSPTIIDGRCLICSSNQKDVSAFIDNKLKSLIVRIDPKQAFGSGSHETTKMIISTLLNMELSNKNVLDCGCGTGILSIVSKKLGALTVCAYDIDDWSVRNSYANAIENNVEISLREGDKSEISKFGKKFDVILANINRNILLADMSEMIKYANVISTIIISGFYIDDVSILEKKANSFGLVVQKVIRNLPWACMVLSRF